MMKYKVVCHMDDEEWNDTELKSFPTEQEAQDFVDQCYYEDVENGNDYWYSIYEYEILSDGTTILKSF